jgi:hypothetical protein
MNFLTNFQLQSYYTFVILGKQAREHVYTFTHKYRLTQAHTRTIIT